MMTLADYFNYAFEVGATEVRIASDAKPEFRVNRKWVKSHFEEMNPNHVRESLFSVLDDEARSGFVTNGFVTGSQIIQNRHVEFVLSQAVNGLHGYFKWEGRKISLNDFSLPPTAFEILRKVSGVSLITGPRSSGKTSLIRLLAENMSVAGFRVALFVDEACHCEIKDVQVFDSQKIVNHSQEIARGFDIIIVDSLNPKAWVQSIQLGNMGLRVISTLPFISAESAIRRLSEEISSQDQIGRSRIVDALQMVLGLRLIEGLDKKSHIAYEILYMTQDIRSFIRDGDWSQVEKIASSNNDDSGMMTLNQSLLNLMLKRKIDLKVGYSESQSPEALDRMFEKIGL